MKAMTLIKEIALAKNLPAIVQAIDDLAPLDAELAPLNAHWAAARAASRARPELRDTDLSADGYASTICSRVKDAHKGRKKGDPVIEGARQLLSRLFPSGLTAVTQINYEDELVELDRIVTALEGPEASWVDPLDLAKPLAGLKAVLVDYRDGVNAPTKLAIEYKSVQAARVASHRGMLAVIAKIAGQYSGSTPAHDAARAELMQPLLEAVEAQQAQRARHATDEEEEVESVTTPV